MNKYLFLLFRSIKNHKMQYPENPLYILRYLQQSQYWSSEELRNYQLERINDLLFKAVESSDYYKQLLKQTVLPVKSLKEYDANIPIITKEIIKEQSEKIKTKYFRTKFMHTSSGTTGDPIIMFNSGWAEAYREAGIYRFLGWWNINPHDNNINLWGKKATSKSDSGIFAIIRSKYRNRYDMNVFGLNNKTIKKYCEEIIRVNPIFIRGYKSGILQLAELIEENHITLKNVKLRLAISTAEVLFENERSYIEKVLKCPVANEYGSSDIGQIAFECPHRSMHVFEEAVYINTNNNNEIIATELYNDSMPLINYKNNDRVQLTEKKCSCGRSSRVIAQIEGRNEDLVIKKNGDKVNPMLFILIINELYDIGLGQPILKWKIYQKENKFQFLIVPKSGYNSKVEDYIKKRMHMEFGNDVLVEFCTVEDIPRDKSGKLTLFSKID